eukprot:TRINITY_DN14942_c0_g2_i1.p1 TRINITY_DN14942_c0_g2~~TRINITY_DN14942_c0_g2_i1.p1  ORF type:complete len:136 (+),score=44.33 TRINITY_DN14942_c0_g2_i1:33-410(+)
MFFHFLSAIAGIVVLMIGVMINKPVKFPRSGGSSQVDGYLKQIIIFVVNCVGMKLFVDGISADVLPIMWRGLITFVSFFYLMWKKFSSKEQDDLITAKNSLLIAFAIGMVMHGVIFWELNAKEQN